MVKIVEIKEDLPWKSYNLYKFHKDHEKEAGRSVNFLVNCTQERFYPDGNNVSKIKIKVETTGNSLNLLSRTWTKALNWLNGIPPGINLCHKIHPC